MDASASEKSKLDRQLAEVRRSTSNVMAGRLTCCADEQANERLRDLKQQLGAAQAQAQQNALSSAQHDDRVVAKVQYGAAARLQVLAHPSDMQ